MTPPIADQEIPAILHRGLDCIVALDKRLKHLDQTMLGGKPQEIAEAAAAVDGLLVASTPIFRQIGSVMEQMGTQNLQAAALYLRAAAQEDAAGMADALRLALKRFAKQSVASNRRAQHINRGLNTALRSLQAIGVQESGRLIAEA
ncbi:MAG: hypothetical protein B7Z80_10045 [Rhodospirillales bacterium 20-64-7]|nr:MAG: hypothetical protein B7Z80_10045 [Rhodospirillales bacterium 20-64-7]